MAVLQSVVTVFIFFLILGVLVVIHELGHFVTARLAGVRVLEFGIGFPPRARVLSSHGDTLYTPQLAADRRLRPARRRGRRPDDPHSFVNARLPLKLVILLAGVAMNLVLALVLFVGTAWFPGGARELQFSAVQVDSPAASAGLVGGEGIFAIDGREWDQFEDPQEIVDTLKSKAGQQVTLGIVGTDGSVRTVTVTLRTPAQIDADHGALGIMNLSVLESPVSFTRSFGDAVAVGAQRTQDAFRLVADGLGQLVNSVAKPTEAPPLAGPVGIAVIVGDVFWQRGLIATLYVAGILSANLALVNILPFPPLDGGRMLMLVIKRVAGNRVSLKAERLTLIVGSTFLFAFLIWVTFFDVARLGGAIP